MSPYVDWMARNVDKWLEPFLPYAIVINFGSRYRVAYTNDELPGTVYIEDWEKARRRLGLMVQGEKPVGEKFEVNVNTIRKYLQSQKNFPVEYRI